ncbi:MAG: hypothetical protein ACREVE_03925 [Gammaproteobacteria bacterium]
MPIYSRLKHGVILSICLTAVVVPAPVAADDFWGALSGGKVDLYLRYRFEHVEDDQLPAVEDANANTLRTALGYTTGLFHGFRAYLQFEDVRAIGNDLYNDGGTNGVTDRAAVVDPEGTEINQAYLSFAGLLNSELRAGRQEITHREDPLHRFLGNILWRQNWQSFDAARFTGEPFSAASIDYSYIWNVNRIFGEDNPLPDRSDFRMDGHALKLKYDGLEWAALESYGYLLDFESDTAEFFSTATYGGRVQGGPALGGTGASLLYTAEFAKQTDYGENANDVDVNYYLGELGLGQTFDSAALTSLAFKASYEVLEGDGTSAFQTPLGTNHAFQGWADRFLITPPDGVEDLYGTVTATVYDATAMLVYHDLSADSGGYDYGTEWDVVVTKGFWEHYTLGLKYAAYDADDNALNLARNGAISDGKQAFDLNKAWVWVEMKF